METNTPVQSTSELDAVKAQLAALQKAHDESIAVKTSRVLSKTWKGLVAGFKSFSDEQFKK